MTATPSLFAGFFQLGYVTRDMDAAVAAFRERFGPTEFSFMSPGARPDGSASPTRRIGLAYVDDLLIEIIEPDSGQPTIFDSTLPDDGAAMRLHHLGYLVDNHDDTLAMLRDRGLPVVMDTTMAGVLDVCFADTRAELGHFSEFVHPHPGRDLFADVPRNVGRGGTAARG